MNNEVGLEGRPRPLSAGLWTLFSWLRRDDRSDSSESLSSAGSDRTVASIAFLSPAHYNKPVATPLIVPPPGPPTDSYKKRVHDRNLRRQYDRDITLHRKYGLFKTGENSGTYDAFSLPPVRKLTSDIGGRWDRDRRATSECYQRRLAHVPGKRRAPLPPVSTIPIASTASLTRRNTRKRRAPPPPLKLTEANKENLRNVEFNKIVTQMNPQSLYEKKKINNNDVAMGCKSEKYIKKDGVPKEPKAKSEKSFLKQIFDSKKRNSGIDISSIKVLPSISELDKQAAEIIESCKLNTAEQKNDSKKIITMLETDHVHKPSHFETWICVICLRKYNSSTITCPHCVQNQKTSSSDSYNHEHRPSGSRASSSYTQTEKSIPSYASTIKNAAEEKQKLKEMLKEMKDSLPKRPKHDLNNKQTKAVIVPEARGTSVSFNSYSSETPTLRVGCTVKDDSKISVASSSSSSDAALKSSLPEAGSSVTKLLPIKTYPATSVQVMPDNGQKAHNIDLENKDIDVKLKSELNLVMNTQKPKQKIASHIEISEQFKEKRDLHTPLKISSLLNPVYIPKSVVVSSKPQALTALQTETKDEKPNCSNVQLDNSKETSQNTSKYAVEVVVAPSTSQMSRLPVSSKNIDIKPKTETIKSAVLPSSSSQMDKVSVAAKKDTQVDSNQKENKVAAPALIINQQINTSKITNASDHHSRRRELIQQLEQSIAKGDELAAAAAAAKLAQLRLSCSVLSFSSQILSKPSTSTSTSKTAIEVDDIVSNKGPVNVSKSEENTKQEIQEIQLSLVKEKLPQKPVSKEIASVSSVKPHVTATTATTAKTIKDKPLEKNKMVCHNIIGAVEHVIKTVDSLNNDAMITIAVLVEDREATRGPVHLRIRRKALMRDLRHEAETSLGLATNLQRWIVGRVLCTNDNTPILSLAGPDFSAPFYLCVVESEAKSDPTTQKKVIEANNGKNTLQNKGGNVYTELVQLEQQALVPNAENFECGVCMEEYTSGRGVVLRECVHIFCKDCLSNLIRHCEEPDIPCPAMGCKGMLQEREIRALVTSQDYERWLARGLAAAESGTRNAFHCRTRDCKGWALCEPGVQRFPCPVCKHINCVPCQAIHDGESCEQHRAKLKQTASKKSANGGDAEDGTRTLLNSLIAKGEALECPECSAIITKKWGCDWVKCSACKTEICWVTRGRRWGPGGKGDTSGGCRCGVDGKRCHPSCGYCH